MKVRLIGVTTAAFPARVQREFFWPAAVGELEEGLGELAPQAGFPPILVEHRLGGLARKLNGLGVGIGGTGWLGHSNSSHGSHGSHGGHGGQRSPHAGQATEEGKPRESGQHGGARTVRNPIKVTKVPLPGFLLFQAPLRSPVLCDT
jgi:hypothetical protein